MGNRKSGRSYHSRDYYLARIGYASYAVYLASGLWKSIRVKVFALKGRACSLCPAEATELHHNRYHQLDLLGERLAHIFPLCRKCHESIEFDGARKRSLHQASIAFAERRQAFTGIKPPSKSEQRRRYNARLASR